MNILDSKYINDKQKEIENKVKEAAEKLSELLKLKARDTHVLENEQKLVHELTKYKYTSLIYSKCKEMINEDKSKLEMINAFKISLNTERYNSKEIQVDYEQKKENKLYSSVINKTIEVQALEEFMEEEIYCFL